MGLERRDMELGSIGLGDERSSGSLTQSGKTVFATETFSMDVNDLIVRGTTGAVSDVTVTLPSVREAAGRIYSISLVTDGGKDVIIEDLDDDAGLTDITLDTAADYAILYSDGYLWREFASEKA